MDQRLNHLSKKEMRLLLESFLCNNVYMDPDDIKMIKIFKFDDNDFEFYKEYAIDYIKHLITLVKPLGKYDIYFDDDLEANGYNWVLLFDTALETASEYSIIFSKTHTNAISVFDTIAYILNAFIDFIEEVLYCARCNRVYY